MKLNEAFEILRREGITSNIESVRRWIRQGKLKATLPSKRDGYRINEEDLKSFIFFKKPHLSRKKGWLLLCVVIASMTISCGDF